MQIHAKTEVNRFALMVINRSRPHFSFDITQIKGKVEGPPLQ